MNTSERAPTQPLPSLPEITLNIVNYYPLSIPTNRLKMKTNENSPQITFYSIQSPLYRLGVAEYINDP